MKRILTSLTLLLACCAAERSMATTRRVLFIGNSYTHTNNMPTMLQAFATAFGDTLIFDMSAPGGYTFQQHTTNATTISKIFAQKWDIVVLQEQSQLPSFPPAQVATEVYPYARMLDSMIKANDSCTQTMFMMTWGRRNGDVMNCASYPVVCTYYGMQGRLRESYMQMALDNDALIAPMGAVWKLAIDSLPTIDLYQVDSSHPSMQGSYLQACVLYNSIFHKKARGCTYTGGLAATVAQTLQRISDKVVLDSMSYWQQYGKYPYAKFSKAIAGGTVTFTNTSTHADDYLWKFGDATTSTATSPVHTYTAPGTYVVSLTAGDTCFTVTVKDTVIITTAGLSHYSGDASPLTVAYLGNGNVVFKTVADAIEMLEVYDATGRRVRAGQVNGAEVHTQLQPGLYIYRAYSKQREQVYSGKVIVY